MLQKYLISKDNNSYNNLVINIGNIEDNNLFNLNVSNDLYQKIYNSLLEKYNFKIFKLKILYKNNFLYKSYPINQTFKILNTKNYKINSQNFDILLSFNNIKQISNINFDISNFDYTQTWVIYNFKINDNIDINFYEFEKQKNIKIEVKKNIEWDNTIKLLQKLFTNSIII